MKWTDMLSVASSIATLTGVSLVWLSTQPAFKSVSILALAFQGVVGLVASLLTVGVTFFLVRTHSSALEEVKPRNVIYVWTLCLSILIVAWLIAMSIIWSFAMMLWSIK
ncbi:hypothetical protein ACIP02_21970 [Pseudomonas sp. NPDC089408]|uniref:hypothetical protein n=1 Tax=Pseudomonas sp. NPDC089408 TaxID=3364465 RepID=UPI003827B205